MVLPEGAPVSIAIGSGSPFAFYLPSYWHQWVPDDVVEEEARSDDSDEPTEGEAVEPGQAATAREVTEIDRRISMR